eukprot:c34850_g1_i1 orf=53-508(-)
MPVPLRRNYFRTPQNVTWCTFPLCTCSIDLEDPSRVASLWHDGQQLQAMNQATIHNIENNPEFEVLLQTKQICRLMRGTHFPIPTKSEVISQTLSSGAATMCSKTPLQTSDGTQGINPGSTTTRDLEEGLQPRVGSELSLQGGEERRGEEI